MSLSTRTPNNIVNQVALPIEPEPTDVLCSRDKESNEHIGNKRFKELVMSHRSEYKNASSREAKLAIARLIITQVLENGGRFLKKDEDTGEWIILADKYVHESVSNALRRVKNPERASNKKEKVEQPYAPTAEEEKLFAEAFADQQRIFQRLIAKSGHAMPVEIETEDDTESVTSDNQ